MNRKFFHKEKMEQLEILTAWCLVHNVQFNGPETAVITSAMTEYKQQVDLDKIQLLAKFFAKLRFDQDPHLNILFELDDLWKKVYEEFRIKKDFYQAGLLANEAVIKKVHENYLTDHEIDKMFDNEK